MEYPRFINRIGLVLFLFLWIGNLASAQENPNPIDWEKVEAQKVAFITDKLSLTVEEAQRFWPIYNEHKKMRDANRGVRHTNMEEMIQGLDKLTEAQLQTKLNAYIDAKVLEGSLKKEYQTKLLKVLPTKKVVLLYQAEHDFKMQLIQILKASEKK